MFAPQELIVTRDPSRSSPGNGRGLWLVKGPPVIGVTLRAQVSGCGFRNGDFDYRLVECSPIARYSIYARPLPLWAFLRVRALMMDSFYKLLRWLYNRGVITDVGPENGPWRLRDLRLKIPFERP